MRRAAQIGAVTVVVALLGLLVWDLAHTKGGDIARNVDKGKVVAAPAWTRPRVDAHGTMSLASLGGKVSVLNFWQSYCAPCTQEARTLADTARSWKQRNVVFVGVDVQDLRGPALAFLNRFDIEYPIVSDGGSLVGRYGVTGYPETFFIDRKGCVVPPHIVGPATRKMLEAGIRRALSSTASCRPRT
jgi:cytochrome c biogenesis protein CcmG/thiol:disulfide interchange protein DsbE